MTSGKSSFKFNLKLVEIIKWLLYGFNLINRPQFKSHETPRNKMVKKKLYSHIMVTKLVKNNQIDDILYFICFYFKEYETRVCKITMETHVKWRKS